MFGGIMLIIGDLIYFLIISSLLVLFFVSLGLFLKRRTINQSIDSQSLQKIETKLDKLIELLEKKSN